MMRDTPKLKQLLFSLLFTVQIDMEALLAAWRKS